MIFEPHLDGLIEAKEGEKNLYSISVTVYELNQITWENMQTRVCVKLGKNKRYTKVKESSDRPYYNEFFSYDYAGSLEKMLDMVLIISVQNYRHGFRSHKLLGSARLDLGAIWAQPGHGIFDKWILLTHPSDPTGQIRGYVNCEIAIVPSGQTPPIRRMREPRDYFIPESQGAGRLKARYIFSVHRGADMQHHAGKETKIFVRVFFAGLSGETTKRKQTSFPVWKEEIVFTELFPPMYNRMRVDVHFGKNQPCTKFLDLNHISDPTVKGYLPTYGPSFLYLYRPPYQYLGSLLVSLETLTVQAFTESERLLGVKRQRSQDLIEKLFWNIEEFALFGVVYELSMFQLKGSEGDLHIRLGFGACEKRPAGEENRFETWAQEAVPMEGSYWRWPRSHKKATLFTKDKLPDLRHRLFLANRLLHVAVTFGRELSKIQFEIEYSPDKANAAMEGALEKALDKCHSFMATAPPGHTKLDQERFKTITAKVKKIIKSIYKVKAISNMKTKFEKCVEIYQYIVTRINDPQESFPLIILTLRKGSKILAYAQIHPRDIIFSTKEIEKGQYCGKIQTVFMKVSLYM